MIRTEFSPLSNSLSVRLDKFGFASQFLKTKWNELLHTMPDTFLE